MQKLLALILVVLLLAPVTLAQSEDGFSLFNLFGGIFGRTEEAKAVTEKQMGEMVEHAKIVGSGASMFQLRPECVHYSIGLTTRLQAEWNGRILKTDFTPESLEAMLRQLEPNITADLGNVNPTYREVIIC